MRNIGIVVEYVGTGYQGFQFQPEAGCGRKNRPVRTVQGSVEDAILRLTGERLRIVGAGRTDAGVHALGQVANFKTDSRIPAQRFAAALNPILPYDIRIVRSFEVPEAFNARFDALWKVYRYLVMPEATRIPAARTGSALLAGRALPTRNALPEEAVEAMEAAGAQLVGRHDFSAFAARGSSAKTSVRTIRRLEVWHESWESLGLDLVVVEIEADGFLYKMARTIVGALLEVGMGRMDPDGPAQLLESRDRRLGPATAPPDGLYLVKVAYPEPIGSLASP
jgi:tRNA pseudouridine38-40 synthase